MDKLFNGGEISKIADAVTELSGYGKDIEKSKKLIYADQDANMMYILFRDKNWKPSDYFSLPYGEKIVVRAFLRRKWRKGQRDKD